MIKKLKKTIQDMNRLNEQKEEIEQNCKRLDKQVSGKKVRCSINIITTTDFKKGFRLARGKIGTYK
jgi:hypothetical protein